MGRLLKLGCLGIVALSAAACSGGETTDAAAPPAETVTATSTVTATDTKTATERVTESETVVERMTATETATKRVTMTPPPVTATETETVEVEVEVEVEPPAAIADIEGDGVWLVGADIESGTYRSTGGNDCYWARLKNLSGGLNGIIANGLGANQVVTVAPSDAAFETTRCGAWTKVG